MSTLTGRIDGDVAAVAAALALGAGTLAAAPLPGEQPLILGITLFCIVLWVANPIPPWFTGLLGIGLIGVGFSPDLALGGFAEPVLWLIVFGLIIGEAIHRTRTAEVIERAILGWIAADAARETNPVRLYRRLLVVLSLGGLAFALMVPSSLVRVLIMAPILIDIGRVFESPAARLGLLFGPLFATIYGALGVLTAYLPNIVITGIVESTTGLSIAWSEWFLSMFPVMGLGRTAVVVAVVYLLYRPSPDSGLSFAAEESAGAGDGGVGRTVAFLAVGVAIWATDFLHGLHPVFGAFVVATLMLLPGVGTVSSDAVEDVDFSIVFFVGGVFAIAAGLSETGFTAVAAESLLAVVPPDPSTPIALLGVFGVTLALLFVIEGLAAASVLTPILASFAAETGIPMAAAVQVEAVALGTLFFPYQSVVLVAILGYDPVEPGDLIRVTSAISLVTIFVLLPLQIGCALYL